MYLLGFAESKLWTIFPLLWISCGAFDCNDNVTIHNPYIVCANPLHVTEEVYEKEFCVCCVFVSKEGDEVNGVHIPVLSPLQAATTNGQLDVVRDLVSKGVDVNDVCLDAGTPLTIAAWKGYFHITEFLVEHGADINVRMGDGSSPLSLAVRYNHSDVAVYLESKLNTTHTDQHDKDCVCCCESWYEYPNGVPIATATPMVAACLSGSLEAVKDQVSKGASVNEGCCMGDSPLHIAAWKGYLDIAQFLVQHGASINAQMFIEGYTELATPLTMAIRHNHPIVAEYLRSKGGRESPL